MELKIKLNTKNGLILWLVGILLFPYILRNKYLPSVVSCVNIISLLGVYFCARKKGGFSTRKIRSASCVIVLICMTIMVVHSPNASSIFRSITAIFVPMFILSLHDLPTPNFENSMKYIAKFSDGIMYFLTLCAVLDLITNYAITHFWANFYNAESLFILEKTNRTVSFYGHSLLTMELAIIYFIIQIIFNLYVIKKRNLVKQTILSFFVIAMSGSKMGLALLLLLVLICYGNVKMLRYIPVLALGLYLGYKAGIFNVLLERLMIGVNSGDITTGRVTSLTRLMQNGVLQFNWFGGHDGSLIDNNISMIAALENPLLRWAYRYGIVFASLMAVLIFLIPFIRIVKTKAYQLSMIALVYISAVNSYDTVCSIGDSMLRYCSVILLIYFAARYSKRIKE